MQKLRFHKKFAEKFKKINEKDIDRIYKRLLLMKDFPFVYLDVKKLRGYKDTYRLRVGNYRIKFVLMGDELVFYDIDLRGKVYKKK
ncbi:hypothetical protein BMS3Bbin15_00915 [archaeon BMS3Bbin15]|nr:hypothetical protein BMS3Bbin15_00915 [archaeon BMS3Bbin15]